MALSKSHTLLNGVTVKHYRVMPYYIDYMVRESSACVAAYVNALVPDSEAAVPVFAQLRLSGDKFDEYLSKAVLSAPDAPDTLTQLYKALKAEPGSVKCDLGGDFFADAVDA
jgi:hypothetical protein